MASKKQHSPLSLARRLRELLDRLQSRPSPDPVGIEPGSPVSVSHALRAEIDEMVASGVPILNADELKRLESEQ